MTVRKFEAIKYALRQNKEGVIVSFVVHPNDVDDELTCLPIGARVVIGWVEFNDEEPTNASVAQERKSSRTAGAPTEDAGSTPAGGSKKERKRFAELPASQQAAMLCDDERFHKFLRSTGFDVRTDVQAADVVRIYCGVKSRADIPNNPVALERWQTLLSRYESWKIEQAYPEGAR